MDTNQNWTIGAPPAWLVQFVELASQLLGDTAEGIFIFGSRPRGEADPLSDYDLFILLRDRLSDETLLQLELAAPGLVDLHFLTRAEVENRLGNLDVGVINILRDSKVLFGELPTSLMDLAREVVKKAALEPRPEISKGAWSAGTSFPPSRPYSLLRDANEMFEMALSAQREEEAVVFDFVGDQALRALLAKCIQGDLAIDRLKILKLLKEEVLTDSEYKALLRCVKHQATSRKLVAENLLEFVRDTLLSWYSCDTTLGIELR